MLRLRHKSGKAETAERCFGLRIEGSGVQLAIAIPLPDGRFRLQLDSISTDSPGGWLSPGKSSLLTAALGTLVSRHGIHQERVAVSLDGDFCVTRIAMGLADKVDKELSMLAVRVPRYLQLGPGEKVTGSARRNIAPAVDYAVTGVVNRSLIQVIYESLRENDLNVAWVEPSLVSVARLLGQARLGGDKPVLIADGTGKQWDVGIACSGRLLLDYRPASATTIESFRDAIEGHISRLNRFCHRYMGIATGELSQLFVYGEEAKTEGAQRVFLGTGDIQVNVLRVPKVNALYEIDDSNCDSNSVPPVATVLPLLIGVHNEDVPDLLDEVRRAPDLPLLSRLLRTGWPAIAAAVLLTISYSLVSGQRYRLAGTDQGRTALETQIEANEVRFQRLSQQRSLLSHLTHIAQQSEQPNWHQLFQQVTQSLPATAKLNSFQVDSDGYVLLNGLITDETQVFELVNDFRRLPGISQVALRGTAPEESGNGTRFTIRLMTAEQALQQADLVEPERSHE
jgi:hypothetical protein